MEINICFASDDDSYIQHLSVAIASVVSNASSENQLNFYILTDCMGDNSQNIISSLGKSNCSFHFVQVDKEVFKNCPILYDYVNIQTYYRLLMATLLPDVDKVIYLDSDLVVNVDIAELFSVDVEDCYVAGVDDIRYYHLRDDGHVRPYFNAGVLLFNLKKITEDNIEQKFFSFIEENQETGLLIDQDQSVINYVLAPKRLDYKWNVQSFSFVPGAAEYHFLKDSIEKAKKRPAILHYTGSLKPWGNYTVPYADLYVRYLQFSPFKKKIKPLEFYFGRIKSYLYKFKKHPFFFLEDKITLLPQIVDYKESKKDKYVEFLKKNGLQKKLDKYNNKKVIIYGTGLIFELMWQNFDFSGMNIIAVSDKKFRGEDVFKDCRAISAEMIASQNPDIVLLAVQNYMFIEDYFEDELFKTSQKFKYQSLLAYSFNEFIMSLFR